jgi:hypothetical protein
VAGIGLALAAGMTSLTPIRDARRLLGADLIAAAVFLAVVLGLAIFSPRPLSFWHASFVLPLVLLGVLVLIALVRGWLSGRRSLAELRGGVMVLVADWLPLILCVLAYENVHDLTYVIRPDTVDAALRALDERLLGATPAAALDPYVRPWLTEVMSGAYALYFVYPALLLWLLYRRGDLTRFREVGLALGLCLYGGLIGYMLVPAVGPRYAMAAELHSQLVGPWLTAPAARAWDAIELIDRDCFPSLHTGLTMLSLVYFVRLRRVLPRGRLIVALITPPIVLLWLSTMYLRYHYAVDVLAGAALALGVAAIAPRIVLTYRDLVLMPAQGRRWRRPWVRAFRPVLREARTTSAAAPAGQAVPVPIASSDS